MSANDIASTTRLCLNYLDILLKTQPLPLLKMDWLEQQSMLLDLWTSTLGVFATGEHAVTYRFRKNVAASRAISQLLYALSESLQTLIQVATPATLSPRPTFPSQVEDASQAVDLPLGNLTSSAGLMASEEPGNVLSNPLDYDMIISEEQSELLHSSSSEGSNDEASWSLEERLYVLKSQIVDAIDDLLRFATAIRGEGSRKRQLRGETYEPRRSDFPESSESERSDGESDEDFGFGRRKNRISPASRFQRYSHFVLMREFGRESFDSFGRQYLTNRLGKCMMTRWRQISYNYAHASRLRPAAMPVRPPVRSRPTPSLGLAVPASVPSVSQEPLRSSPQPRDAPSESAATTFKGELPTLRPKSTKTTSSKTTSRWDSVDLDLPRPPELRAVHGGYIYTCQYCSTLQKTTKKLSKQAWKAHLWADLAPYTCLYEHCTRGTLDFDSIHEWREHIVSEHARYTWQCTRCERPGRQSTSVADSITTYKSESELTRHYRSLHSGEMREDDMTTIVRYSRRTVLDECLICGSTVGMQQSNSTEEVVSNAQLQEDLLRCMSTHLESLALSCIPWQLGSPADARSSQAQGSEVAHLGEVDPDNPLPDDKGLTVGADSGDRVNLESLKYEASRLPEQSMEQQVTAWTDLVETCPDDEPESAVDDGLASASQSALDKATNPAGGTFEDGRVTCDRCGQKFDAGDYGVHWGSHQLEDMWGTPKDQAATQDSSRYRSPAEDSTRKPRDRSLPRQAYSSLYDSTVKERNHATTSASSSGRRGFFSRFGKKS